MSFEPRHGKDPTGWHVVLKPGHNGRQAVREPAHRTSERYDQGRGAYPDSSIRRFMVERGVTVCGHLDGHIVLAVAASDCRYGRPTLMAATDGGSCRIPLPSRSRRWARGDCRAGGHTLDVVCGLGTEAAHLAAAGWQVAGIDLSQTALARAAAAHGASRNRPTPQ